ncbi:MAG: ATP-binding protein [Anaerolineae bacterium]|nr:ATP-binding protein [Anaerolineae bacterium]MDW8070653.1 ATP-binding protein [Anaerolineae bacterium]
MKRFAVFRSLTFKLVLAFMVVSIVGVMLSTLFARWVILREFDRLVAERAENTFVAEVQSYYEVTGSWQGVEIFLHNRMPMFLSSTGRKMMHRQMVRCGRMCEMMPSVFALADRDGVVVVPAGPYQAGERVDMDVLRRGIQITVDGRVVGTVLPTGLPPEMAPREVRYLSRINYASFMATSIAMAIALVLGVFLARRLSQPLRELTTATRAMARGELEQRVPVRSHDELGELAAAFNQMSADLARAHQMRRQMTADIAHELRTPLTVMVGYLEALRDGVLKPTPERFEAMYQEARHLERLVEDLRTLSLADAGELSLNREKVSPRLVLEQAATIYRHQAEQRGISLEVALGDSLPDIYVDPDRIAQVLGNLISNAIRYTPSGGCITMSAACEADKVVLRVQDTGSGIAPEDLPYVFDRFYRGNRAPQSSGGESGLGLAIARSIVEAHGGSIAVTSAPDHGSTFTVTLPCVNHPPANREQGHVKSCPCSPNLRDGS